MTHVIPYHLITNTSACLRKSYKCLDVIQADLHTSGVKLRAISIGFHDYYLGLLGVMGFIADFTNQFKALSSFSQNQCDMNSDSILTRRLYDCTTQSTMSSTMSLHNNGSP